MQLTQGLKDCIMREAAGKQNIFSSHTLLIYEDAAGLKDEGMLGQWCQQRQSSGLVSLERGGVGGIP